MTKKLYKCKKCGSVFPDFCEEIPLECGFCGGGGKDIEDADQIDLLLSEIQPGTKHP